MANRLLAPLVPRSPAEEHRTSTPLELFFDLVFVVAVAYASSGLHHALSSGHAFDGIVSFTLVFFAIWWAWMNFTWFASAYDNDNVPYRLLVFVQLSGALILAAGVPRAFSALDFSIMTLGYVVMRIALVIQWLRVAQHDEHRRAPALRYAWGISIAQVGWIGLLLVPEETKIPLIMLAIAIELCIPMWAENVARTPWHAEHIIERYGLFTIIVLGESILAASLAIQAVSTSSGNLEDLLTIIAGGLIILFSMWWIYFDQPEHDHLLSFGSAMLWGYGHFLIFSSAAAVGAGIAVIVDLATQQSHISQTVAHLTVTLPVAVYLMSLWAIHFIPTKKTVLKALLVPTVSGLVLASSFANHSLLITGGLLVALTVSFGFLKRRAC